MDSQKLEEYRDEYIEVIKAVLEEYSGANRKSLSALSGVILICGIALYILFFDLFGGFWGYILVIGLFVVVWLCCKTLGISFKNAPTVSDGQLAYHACVAMEALIKIKKGTYPLNGFNRTGVGEGRHPKLYKEFARLYPELASKNLKSLARIAITRTDISSLMVNI